MSLKLAVFAFASLFTFLPLSCRAEDVSLKTIVDQHPTKPTFDIRSCYLGKDECRKIADEIFVSKVAAYMTPEVAQSRSDEKLAAALRGCPNNHGDPLGVDVSFERGVSYLTTVGPYNMYDLQDAASSKRRRLLVSPSAFKADVDIPITSRGIYLVDHGGTCKTTLISMEDVGHPAQSAEAVIKHSDRLYFALIVQLENGSSIYSVHLFSFDATTAKRPKQSLLFVKY